MAVAMAYPEPEKGGRGKTGKVSKLFGEFAGELLRQARFVLRVTPTVAQSVVAGEKPLAVAYDEAKVIEAERAEFSRKLERLRSKRCNSCLPPRVSVRATPLSSSSSFTSAAPVSCSGSGRRRRGRNRRQEERAFNGSRMGRPPLRPPSPISASRSNNLRTGRSSPPMAGIEYSPLNSSNRAAQFAIQK
jgi:RNase P subunit RPR2